MQTLVDVIQSFGYLMCVEGDVLKPSDHLLYLRILISLFNEFKLVQPQNQRASIDAVIQSLEDEKATISVETMTIWNEKTLENLTNKLKPLENIFSENDCCVMAYYLCARLNDVKQQELQDALKTQFVQFIEETQTEVLKYDDLNTMVVLKEFKTVRSPVYDFIQQNQAFLTALLSKNADEWWAQLPEQLKNSVRQLTQVLHQIASDVDSHPDLKRRCGLFIPNEIIYEKDPLPSVAQADFQTAITEALVGLAESATVRFNIKTTTKTYIEKSDWLKALADIQESDFSQEIKNALMFVPVLSENEHPSLLTDETIDSEEEKPAENTDETLIDKSFNFAFFKSKAFYNRGYFKIDNLKLLKPDLAERITSLAEVMPLIGICRKALPNLIWQAFRSDNHSLAFDREYLAGFKILCLRFPVILEVFDQHLPTLVDAAENWNHLNNNQKKRPLQTLANSQSPSRSPIHKRRNSVKNVDDDNDDEQNQRPNSSGLI